MVFTKYYVIGSVFVVTFIGEIAFISANSDVGVWYRSIFLLTLFSPFRGSFGTLPQFFHHKSQKFSGNSLKLGDFS